MLLLLLLRIFIRLYRRRLLLANIQHVLAKNEYVCQKLYQTLNHFQNCQKISFGVFFYLNIMNDEKYEACFFFFLLMRKVCEFSKCISFILSEVWFLFVFFSSFRRYIKGICKNTCIRLRLVVIF